MTTNTRDECVHILPLTSGYVAVVDEDDYEELSRWKWSATGGKRTYAYRQDNGKMVRMHRYLLKPPSNMDVDHIDGDGLNNRRSNLRIATRSQNNQNQRAIRGGTSIFKGVSLHRETLRWRTHICVNGRSTHIGYFASEVEAALAYNVAAERHFGEFAKLNIVTMNGAVTT